MSDEILSPQECWRSWVIQIARDPEMSRDRAMRHLQKHVARHMPDENATKERWEEWLGGTYNLLAILGCMIGIDPKHDVGVDLLFRKWVNDPTNYTPPPKKIKKTVKKCKQCGKNPNESYTGSGS